MRRSLRTLSLVLIGSLSACGGGNGTSIPSSGANNVAPTSPTVPNSVSSFAYGAKLLAGRTSSTPANLGTIKVDVALNLRDGAGLAQYARAVSTPKSGAYRHFLTPAQIADQYGATAADYAKTAAYFRGFGLSVGGWTQRLSLAVSGPQSAMESAFHTHFVSYATAQGVVYGPKEKPSFGIALPVVAVANLVSAAAMKQRALVHVTAPSGAGQNQASGYVPQQIAAAFDFNGAYNAGFRGDGISIGIIGTGPIDQNDYATFKRDYGVQGTATITQIAASAAAGAIVQGGLAMGSPTATPPPVTGPCAGPLPGCNPEDAEAQIDTEQAASLGYDANVLFYLAYVPSSSLGPQIGIDETDDEIQQAIMDNTADVLSLSFGGAELANTQYFLDANNAYTSSGFGPTEFAALAAEGIATFVSSGDSGAQGCAAFGVGSASANCLEYPASDASVTAVGGVTTPLDNAGRFVGPMTAWGLQTHSGSSGTGGGISAYVPQPAWQTGAGVTAGLRTVPDVSLEADQSTGVSTIVNASFGFAHSGAYGGTSVAAPETAAMWALVLSACKQTAKCAGQGTGPHPYRLGNAAPLFYGIYNSATQYPTTFYDVLFGNNGVIPCTQLGFCFGSPTPEPGFNAGVGYDLTTGIGVPFARHLIQTIVGV
jgi:subtilase family serine protease